MELKLRIFLYPPNKLPSEIEEEVNDFLRNRYFPQQPQVVLVEKGYREVWVWYWKESGQPPRKNPAAAKTERS